MPGIDSLVAPAASTPPQDVSLSDAQQGCNALLAGLQRQEDAAPGAPIEDSERMLLQS